METAAFSHSYSRSGGAIILGEKVIKLRITVIGSFSPNRGTHLQQCKEHNELMYNWVREARKETDEFLDNTPPRSGFVEI